MFAHQQKRTHYWLLRIKISTAPKKRQNLLSAIFNQKKSSTYLRRQQSLVQEPSQEDGPCLMSNQIYGLIPPSHESLMNFSIWMNYSKAICETVVLRHYDVCSGVKCQTGLKIGTWFGVVILKCLEITVKMQFLRVGENVSFCRILKNNNFWDLKKMQNFFEN